MQGNFFGQHHHKRADPERLKRLAALRNFTKDQRVLVSGVEGIFLKADERAAVAYVQINGRRHSVNPTTLSPDTRKRINT